MKKTNKNNCAITRLWPSVEDMKKDLFIDLHKQEVTRISTGNKLKKHLTHKKNNEPQYYFVQFSLNNKIKNLKLHRLIFYWVNSYLPPLVDHKDNNSLNNKAENLRELNSKGNARNSKKKIRKNCSSKYKGVSKDRNKWASRIRDLDGKKDIWIGSFNSEDEAGQAVNDKIRELGLEEVSVMNDTPQERARKISLFDNLEPITDLK